LVLRAQLAHKWLPVNGFEQPAPFSTEPSGCWARLTAVELLEDPDAALVAACRQPGSDGFERAFEELFTRYRDRVYAIAFRVLGNAVDALDVVQESFALVFRKLGSFRGGSLFSTWLFRIVVNSSIDHRRKHSNRPLVGIDDAEDLDHPDQEPGPVDRAETSELAGQVQSALDVLSPKLRAILALRYLEDMSYDELAVTLSLSLGTVKSRLARAHLALEQVVRTRFPQLDLGAGPDMVGGVG
jgi:RNA polymerase sigma-70 factor (ECF subfamily)